MASFLAQPSRLQRCLSGYVRGLTITAPHFRRKRSLWLSASTSTNGYTTHSPLALRSGLDCFPLHRPAQCSWLFALHVASITTGRPLLATVPSASTASSARASASASVTTAPLPLVYQHDRSSYYRLLTIAAAASLGLLWLPLCYVSLVVASPPLYSALLGPLAAIATLVATHFRARRIIHTLHRAPAGLLVHTYNGTRPATPHRPHTV